MNVAFSSCLLFFLFALLHQLCNTFLTMNCLTFTWGFFFLLFQHNWPLFSSPGGDSFPGASRTTLPLKKPCSLLSDTHADMAWQILYRIQRILINWHHPVRSAIQYSWIHSKCHCRLRDFAMTILWMANKRRQFNHHERGLSSGKTITVHSNHGW